MATLSLQPSLDMPSHTASRAVPTSPSLDPKPTEHIRPTLANICSDYDCQVPGIAPATLTDWQSSSALQATGTMTSSNSIPGLLSYGPTSPDGPWYRQPWTVPVGWGLAMYSVFSMATFVILALNNRMDWRLNWVSRPITEREWVAGRVQEANLPSLTTPLSLLNPTSHYHHHVSRVASQPAALISSASLVETELGTESVHRTPFHPVDINGDMEMRVLARGSVHHYMTPISNDADLEVPSIMHPATRFPTRWQSLIHSNQHLLEDNFEMQPDRQELPRRREMLSIDEYPGEIRLGVAARMLRTAAAGNPFDMLPSRESTIRENQVSTDNHGSLAQSRIHDLDLIE